MKANPTDSAFSAFEDVKPDRLGAVGAHSEKIVIKGEDSIRNQNVCCASISPISINSNVWEFVRCINRHTYFSLGAFWDYVPELSQASKMIKTQQGSASMTAYDFGYPSSYDSDASVPYEGNAVY